MDSLSEMQSCPRPKIDRFASIQRLSHSKYAQSFLFSTSFSPLKALSTCSFCFKVSLDQKEAINELCFPHGNRKSFPSLLGHSSFISVKVTEDLHELHKYAKPPFLTPETTLLCSRRFLYSIINLYWQLQLTRWNVKHEKLSSLKHMCQVLRNVILVFMLASYRLWYSYSINILKKNKMASLI